MNENHRNTSKPVERERPEPTEGAKPWPYALCVFFGIMIGWGSTYLVFQSGDGSKYETSPSAKAVEPPPTTVAAADSQPAADGKEVFTRICMPCHQADGNGLPGAFPPLAGSEWVLEDSGIPIKIVLNGLQGPLVVKGASFNGAMPAFRDVLSDSEIAAVVGYVRSEFGNHASPLPSSKDVLEYRESTKTRSSPWTAEELKK